MSIRKSVVVFLLSVSLAVAGAQTSATQEKALRPSSPLAEDWTTLSIHSVNLQLFEPVVIEHDVLPSYTRDIVRVQWRGGDPIELFVYLPREVVKPPAILYLYSYPTDINRFMDQGWAMRATQNGFAAVGFVSALTGQRYHTRPMKQWFVSNLQESLGSSVHDVQMILEYLASRGDVDMGRIGMFGQGSGGAIAVLAAQADTRIQSLDLLDPWGDWPDWLKSSILVPDSERPEYLKPAFLESVANLDPVKYLGHLNVKSLRIQQITDDVTTPKVASDHIAAAAPVEDVVRYPNAGAHFQAAHAGGVSAWLKSQLSTPTSTGTSDTKRDATERSPSAQHR